MQVNLHHTNLPTITFNEIRVGRIFLIRLRRFQGTVYSRNNYEPQKCFDTDGQTISHIQNMV